MALLQNPCKLHRISLYDTYFVLLRILMNHALLYSVLGYTADIASRKPGRPSMQVINMSSTPRFLSPFRICSQYFALSFSPMYISSTSFLPSITQLTIKLRFKSVFGNFAYHPLKKRSQVMQIVNFKRNDKNFVSLSFLSCFAARTSGLSLYFGMIIPPK